MSLKPGLATVATALVALGCGEISNGSPDVEPAQSVEADQLLAHDPYMGVACETPNSFECDRVGLAVTLREPAASVDAAIAGRELKLDDPDWSEPSEEGERRHFAGFLQPAGLIDGPIKVTPDDGPGRWIGREPVSADVDLHVVGADGTATDTEVEVNLSAGWG